MKKKVIIILSVLLIVLVLSIFIYDKFVLNLFYYKYFSVEYGKEWEYISEDDSSIYLSKNDKSYIQIVSFESNSNKSDIYFDLHKKFLDDNKGYKLLSSGETTIGKNYYEGYKYLFQNDKYETLLIIVYHDGIATQINYTSDKSDFLFDLEYFYNVVNTLEF